VSKRKRAYKFRFYPTDEQKNMLAQTFGCVRFVSNWGLHTKSSAYKERAEKLSYNELAGRLPDLKKQYPWLKEASSVPIQQSLRHLERAFVNFFEGRAKYPHFKKKQNAQSATYASNAFKWENDQLTLAKMSERPCSHLPSCIAQRMQTQLGHHLQGWRKPLRCLHAG
jgi:putative transposase